MHHLLAVSYGTCHQLPCEVVVLVLVSGSGVESLARLCLPAIQRVPSQRCAEGPVWSTEGGSGLSVLVLAGLLWA